jgi:hypothetical protein
VAGTGGSRSGTATCSSPEHLAQWVTSVDEKAAVRYEGSAQTRQRPPASFGMAAVESTNAHGEGEVEGCFVLLEHKVLDPHPSEAEHTGLNLSARAGQRLGHGSGRAVDAQDVTRTDPPGNLAGGCAGAAADLQDADAPVQGQGVDDGP